MSENKDLPKAVDAIQFDSIIDLKISGGFYSRFHQLLSWYAAQKPLDEFTAEMAALKADKPPSEYAYHLETILTLIHSTEVAAKEQGKMSSIETDKIIKKE